MSTDVLESPLRRVSLTQLVDTAGLIALTVTGVAIFLPALIVLLGSPSADPATWVSVVVPLAIWLSGFTPALREQRRWVQSGASLVLFVLAMTVGTVLPLPYVTITFAAIVAAVFTLPVWAAVTVIMVTSVIDIVAYSTNPMLLAYPEAPLLPGLAGALLNVCAGGGLLLAWRSWLARIAEAEAEYEQVQEAVQQQDRADARQRGTASVARRIHETILNTLTALSLGVSPDSANDARLACRHDLEQMALGLDPLPHAMVTQVIAAARALVTKVDVAVDVPPTDDVLLAASVANPLRDALVEALRNVERHSGMSTATIRVRTGATLQLEVIDEGIGLRIGAEERFGLRNTLRSGMTSIGGSARVHSPASGGTVVVLSAPLDHPAERPALGLRTLRMVDSSRWARLGVLGTNLFMLILLVPVAHDFDRPLLLGSFVLLYIATLAVLALAWQRMPRTLLTWLAAVLLVATFVTAASGPPQCTELWSVNTLFAGMSGGALLLPLLALSTWRSRLILTVLVVASSSLLAWAMPSECRGAALLELSVTSAYVAAFAIGLSWVEIVFERQRDLAQAQWNDVLARQLDDESKSAAESAWESLDRSTIDFLEGIADGSTDVLSPALSARAAAEADLLRTSLGLMTNPGDAVSHLTRRLVRTATVTGATVEVEMLSDFTRTDRYPEEAILAIEAIVSRDPLAHVILRGFSDAGYEELVAVLPGRLTDLAERQTFSDTEIRVLVGDSETHVLVRRPVAEASTSR